MSWTRRDVLALGSFAIAGAVLAPSAAAAQTPKRGGMLRIRGWDPPLFDAMLTTAYRVHVPLSLTHSRLVRHKAGPSVAPGTFTIEGDLAESWTQPNETTYVFKLRRGVRWHPKPPVNGRELTSADVKYTIERFLTLKGNPGAYMLRAIDRVETPDPQPCASCSRSRMPGSSRCSPTRCRWRSWPARRWRSGATSSAPSR